MDRINIRCIKYYTKDFFNDIVSLALNKRIHITKINMIIINIELDFRKLFKKKSFIQIHTYTFTKV